MSVPAAAAKPIDPSLHEETLATFARFFPPNPYKHGRVLDRDPQTGKKRVVTWDGQPVQLQFLKSNLGIGGKLAGHPLGYLPGGEDSTTVGAIDLDGKDFPGDGIDEAKRAVLETCAGLNLNAYAERSSSGKGWHVWLFTNEAIPYKVMRDALRAIAQRSGLPKVETYPMGDNAKGRWIITPYYGALKQGPPYLGKTYLENDDGQPIPVDELHDWITPNPADALQALAAEEAARVKPQPAQVGRVEAAHGAAGELPPEAVEVLLAAARAHAPAARHDALAAFLNLGQRAGNLAGMVEGLKAEEVFSKWCGDGSRTTQEWAEEIDRWAESVESGTEENRRGIPYLKQVGFRIPDLPTSRQTEDDHKRPPAGTRVLEYAQEDGAELWHDQGGNAYLTATVSGHREHYRLPSRAARDYLQALFYDREKRALNSQAQGEAVTLMQAIARREGNEYRTAVRLAHVEGVTYIDLGMSTWEAVEVGKGYWKIIKPHDCPVRFTRPAGFLPLPAPVEGGHLEELGEFLNTDPRGLMMCTAWMLGAVSGVSPYPLLALSGEQGTGKSTAASVLRNLLDPNQADRRRAPKEERDLFIAAQNTHVLSFDNLSSVPAWLSDSLCVLSTGGAFTARTLYSDNEETILEAVRPVIMNGIPDLLARPDLAERALTVTLYRIPDSKRTPERVFWARYGRARGRLLGALLTALGRALAALEHTELERAPRLADFARLIVAGESALPWRSGEFLSEYSRMQSEAASTVLEGEPVAEALRAFIDDEGEWKGTVKKLLGILEGREYPDTRPPAAWPRTARALGASLRRLAPALSKTGYMVTPAGRSSEGEQYTLQRTSQNEAKEPTQSSSLTAGPCDTPKRRVNIEEGKFIQAVQSTPGAGTQGSQGELPVKLTDIAANEVHRKNSVLDRVDVDREGDARSIPFLSTEGEL